MLSLVLAFPAWRRGFFKATGGVITEAIRRGHRVCLIHAHDAKPGEGVTVPELAQRWPVVSFKVPSRVDAVLGPSLYTYRDRLPRGRSFNLDLAWEAVTAPPWFRGTHCFASAYQLDVWQRAHGSELIAPAIWEYAITGSPMIDGFAGLPAMPRILDPERGLRPIVVLFALKFPKNSGLWRRHWYRWTAYARLLHAIRHFCDRMDAHLIIKTREKNRDPFFLEKMATLMVGEDALWPYRSLELVSTANLVIHFQSGAALEAAFAGVPQISVLVPHPHLQHYPGHHEVFEDSGMHDWPGVVSGMGWKWAPSYFDALDTWPTVNVAERSAYVMRFLGFDDCRSSARILDLVEAGE